MTRKTVNIAIRALPGGQIRAVRDPSGSIPVYEDQIMTINEIMKKAHTIQDAKELLYTSAIRYDRHHADPNVPTPKTIAQVNMRTGRIIRQKKETREFQDDDDLPRRKQIAPTTGSNSASMNSTVQVQTSQMTPIPVEEPIQKSKGVVQPQPKSSH